MRIKGLFFFMVLITVMFSCIVYFIWRSLKLYMVASEKKVTFMGRKPNIIFILTDDQDIELRSLFSMQKLKLFITQKGASFSSAYVASPLCCPSRSSILTGQYVHNHGAINNSINGGCSSQHWQAGPERRSFITVLQANRYKTFFAGKYLNQYGIAEAGGVAHVPPGWDWWIGLRGNSKYYNYTLSINGSAEVHGNDPRKDYLTDIISVNAMKFLDTVIDTPFFMMLSTPACHAPFIPKPSHSKNFSRWRTPKTRNFNTVNDKGKHWLLRLGQQPLSKKIVKKLDEIYRNRLRTLLSVDDMIAAVVDKLKSQNLLDNTYIFFTSDNGYHLGQFSLPLDKREPYEFDTHVPLIVRGPGIRPGITIHHPVINIDLAPTFLDIAGIKVPTEMDGNSFKSLLLDSYTHLKHSQNVKTNRSNAKPLTKTMLFEHSGEGHHSNPGCEFLGSGLYGCSPDYGCKCSDSFNNTFNCIRHISITDNYVYCAWDDSVNFEEFYDLNKDPYQMKNIIGNISYNLHRNCTTMLEFYRKCKGEACR